MKLTTKLSLKLTTYQNRWQAIHLVQVKHIKSEIVLKIVHEIVIKTVHEIVPEIFHENIPAIDIVPEIDNIIVH